MTTRQDEMRAAAEIRAMLLRKLPTLKLHTRVSTQQTKRYGKRRRINITYYESENYRSGYEDLRVLAPTDEFEKKLNSGLPEDTPKRQRYQTVWGWISCTQNERDQLEAKWQVEHEETA